MSPPSCCACRTSTTGRVNIHSSDTNSSQTASERRSAHIITAYMTVPAFINAFARPIHSVRWQICVFDCFFFNTESYSKHPDAASLKRTKASKWPTRKNTLSSPRRDTHYCPEKTRRVLPQQLRLDSRKWWIPLPIQNSGRILWCLLRFSSAARILVLRSILWLAYSIISPHAPIHG